MELTSFTGDVLGSSVILSWSTATETNNSGFQVERGDDSENFAKIGFVPGFGTTTQSKSYTFTDNSSLSETYYYRLKQIDYDGNFTYSEVVEVNLGLPSEFALQQNYPNPFNPTTKITYSVPADGFVNIAVYNVLGEKVANLLNTNVKAGNYDISFDATNLTSGMYLYRMEAGDFVSVKKMMILK